MAQTAYCQTEEEDIILTTIPEGPLGTEVPVGEEVLDEGEDDMMASGEEDDGIKPADEGMHEGHHHEGHHDHKHMLTEKCLLKSESIGMPAEGDDIIDDTSAITASLMAHHMPYEYFVCIKKDTNELVSLQMTFADEVGEDIVKLPLIGPDSGDNLYCGPFKFNDRGPPVSVIMFEENMMVNGLGITYEDN